MIIKPYSMFYRISKTHLFAKAIPSSDNYDAKNK